MTKKLVLRGISICWKYPTHRSQLFEKASSRNIKLRFLAFNMQWLFGSTLEPTTKIIVLDTFFSQNLRFFILAVDYMLGLLSSNFIMCLESLEMLENDERVKKCNFLSTSGGGRLGLDFFLGCPGCFLSAQKNSPMYTHWPTFK